MKFDAQVSSSSSSVVAPTSSASCMQTPNEETTAASRRSELKLHVEADPTGSCPQPKHFSKVFLAHCTWMFAACEVEPEASSVEKSVVLRPAGRPLIKGEIFTPSTLRPSSARILQAAGSVATSSLPSPGTCPIQDLWRFSSIRFQRIKRCRAHRYTGQDDARVTMRARTELIGCCTLLYTPFSRA